MICYRKEASDDMVPPGLPVQGADDEHGDACQPGERVPRPDLPLLRRLDDPPVWAWAQLHPVLELTGARAVQLTAATPSPRRRSSTRRAPAAAVPIPCV